MSGKKPFLLSIKIISNVEGERPVSRRHVSKVEEQAQQSLVYSDLCSPDLCIVCNFSVSCARTGHQAFPESCDILGTLS